MTPSKFLKFASLVVAIIFTLGMAHTLQAQLIVDGFANPINDRFTNDSSFILGGNDISGVGQTPQGRWATAISPNVIVSATHANPNGQVVSFFPGNDPTATPVTRTVVSGQAVINTSTGIASDLWVGVLDSNLPSSISPFNFLNNLPLSATPQPNTGLFLPSVETQIAPLLNQSAFIFGRSPIGTSAVTNQAIGRNRISGYAEDLNVVNRDTDALVSITDAPNTTFFVPNEAATQAGDSGAPFFIELQNGELLLLGVNGFTTSGDVSGFDYIGNEGSFISDFIEINAVPEPGSAFALSMIMGACLARRRRQV